MVDVRNREELQAWFKTQPRSVRVTVAVRAALRALPLIMRWPRSSKWPLHRVQADFQASVLRAISATRLADNAPSRVARAAGAAAADAAASTSAVAFADTAASAASAVAYAADAAAASTDYGVAYAALAVAYAASAVALAAFADADSAAYIDTDSAAFADGARLDIKDVLKFRLIVDHPPKDVTRVLRPILARPLWHGWEVPTSIAGDWHRISTQWGHRPPPGTASSNNWWVWTEWYQAILDGTLDDARAKLYGTVPDKLWKQGIDVVNAHIAAKLRAMEIKALSKQRQSALGDQWTTDVDRFKLDTAGGKTDARAAQNADVERRHAELKEKVADLKGDAARLADIDWGGLANAVDKLDHVLAGPTSDVPARIRAIYDYSLSLAHFLEEDNDLRRDVSSTNKRPLPPELRRKLVEIVRQLALWVRSFPTARKQDEELGGYIGQVVASTANAQLLINSASAAALISEEDRQLLIALIDAVRNNGPVSTKAAKKGIATTTNFIVKAASYITAISVGILGSGIANESELVKRFSKWAVSKEKPIIELIDQEAPDISLAIRSLLEDLRTRPGNPSAPSQGSDALFPSPPPPIRRRDR